MLGKAPSCMSLLAARPGGRNALDEPSVAFVHAERVRSRLGMRGGTGGNDVQQPLEGGLTAVQGRGADQRAAGPGTYGIVPGRPQQRKACRQAGFPERERCEFAQRFVLV